MSDDVVSLFNKIDREQFPDISHYLRPMEKSLWILCIMKDLGGIKQLTADQISKILREGLEINLPEKSIINSLKNAGDRIFVNNDEGIKHYEIMAIGRDFLMSKAKTTTTSLFYFEPEKKYTSKRILSNNLIINLKGELKIVDPYLGERTLDVLSNVKNDIKFLTRLSLIKTSQQKKIKREYSDYRAEHKNIEIRDYNNNDLHDRYIISDDHLVLLGHSFKDLGNKESFAVILNKNDNINIYDAMLENFNRRWKKSIIIK